MRKRRRTVDGVGEPYERFPETTAQLQELIGLPREELVERCRLPRSSPQYVRTECVLYFVRCTRAGDPGGLFDRLYRLLVTRVLQRLPNAERGAGAEAYGAGEIRDRTLHRLLTMLSEDHHAYSERLDFFEVRFDGALKRLRIDAERSVGRDEKRFTGLSYDDESGELSEEVEKAAGDYDPFRGAENASADYRSRLDAAIDALPVEQIRIIEMLRLEIAIESRETYAVTIAKTLGRAEKTIRNQRDRAYEAIRRRLQDGDDQ